jgi:hypothetical protein
MKKSILNIKENNYQSIIIIISKNLGKEIKVMRDIENGSRSFHFIQFVCPTASSVGSTAEPSALCAVTYDVTTSDLYEAVPSPVSTT